MEELPAPIRDSLDFERSNWVSRVSVVEDDFYNPPQYSEHDEPGKLLKVDQDVDPTKYFLPPATALTRIAYLSETAKKSPVPVSAAILWPYAPKTQSDGSFPVVAWAHGTSSLTQDGAPSHHQNFWQHFLAPFQLVLNGYVVVATDYAGLGVHHDMKGDPIVHPYLAAPSHANDVVYSVKAAHTAFPKLSKDFVVIGHSQGGGAAWAVAQKAASSPSLRCLGCVPVSPTTRVLDEPDPFGSLLCLGICDGLKATLPDVDLDALLTPSGRKLSDFVRASGAGVATCAALMQPGVIQPHFKKDKHVIEYQEMIATGGKAIGCPMLVVHGEADPRLSPENVKRGVERTRDIQPHSQIELVLLPGITHNGALTGSQRLWMEWIADRFAGRPVNGSTFQRLESARPQDQYSIEQNWYLKQATEFYHAP